MIENDLKMNRQNSDDEYYSSESDGVFDKIAGKFKNIFKKDEKEVDEQVKDANSEYL